MDEELILRLLPEYRRSVGRSRPGFDRFSGDHVAERYAAETGDDLTKVRVGLVEWAGSRGGWGEYVRRLQSRGLRTGRRVAPTQGRPALVLWLPRELVGD